MIIVQLDPERELAKVLDAAGTTPVTVVSHGQRFAMTRQPHDRTAEHAQEDFRAAHEAAAGVFTPEEGERLEQDFYRWREEGLRPLDCP